MWSNLRFRLTQRLSSKVWIWILYLKIILIRICELTCIRHGTELIVIFNLSPEMTFKSLRRTSNADSTETREHLECWALKWYQVSWKFPSLSMLGRLNSQGWNEHSIMAVFTQHVHLYFPSQQETVHKPRRQTVVKHLQ